MSRKISKDEIDRFHDYSLYVPQRTVYMGSESVNNEHEESGTDTVMAERQIKNLLILDSMSQEPITIIMNNLGGDVSHGLAIYDAIKSCKSHVTIKVFGQAMSMGSIILQAADERIMAPNAVQMIHYGHLSVDADAKTTYKHADENKRVDKWMEQLYLEKINQKDPHFKLPRLQRMLQNDHFLTAKQSLELGLIDKILGED
jgi:ATP-dependent Clp protease, protease subunit